MADTSQWINPTTSNTTPHPSSVDTYIRHGWSLVPIPAGTKGPHTIGWNRKENALASATHLPPGYGIGLAHAYSGTMALDIDNLDRAAVMLAEHQIDLRGLFDAPDAVMIHSGNPGHAKLLYAMPFGLALPSRKLVDTDDTGSKYNYLDFRCATANGLTTQDVLPPTMHPTTGQPYRWDGKGHWTRLPLIPPPLLTLWSGLLKKDQQRVIETSGPVNTNWEEIKQAVESINPDISREEWVHVGMALHWAGERTDMVSHALAVWNEWSRGSEKKYPGEREILTQWRSFKTNKASIVTLGTLFTIAARYGYNRPALDVTSLFTAITPTAPETILSSLRPAPPDMRMGAWPAVLATRAEQVGVQMGCDPLIALFAGLAAASGAADARTRLELVPGFKVPPILWIMAIGAPAMKKSPASRPMVQPLKDIQNEDRPRFANDLLTWEGHEAAHLSARKAFLAASADPEALLGGSVLPNVPALPPQPVPLRLVVSDVSSQKLIRQAADRPRGLLCHLDEMAGWIKKLTDKVTSEDRSSWVVSYEGDSYDMDRVGAGSIHCDNLAVSIYGNVQPKVFRKAFDTLATDGLLQRFIPVVLREKRWGRGEPVPACLTNATQWDTTLRMIYSLPAITYRLDPEAFALFRDFQDWYEDAKMDEMILRSGDVYMTSYGKLEGTLGRLALVMHLIDNPMSLLVSKKTMLNAISIVRGYIIPSYRYAFGEVAGTDNLDRWMVEQIVYISGDTETVSLRQLKRSARRLLDEKTSWEGSRAVLDAMVTLEQAGWVTPIINEMNRDNVVWAINKNITTLFAEDRVRVIKARQRTQDYGWYKNENSKRRIIKGFDPATMDGG